MRSRKANGGQGIPPYWSDKNQTPGNALMTAMRSVTPEKLARVKAQRIFALEKEYRALADKIHRAALRRRYFELEGVLEE